MRFILLHIILLNTLFGVSQTTDSTNQLRIDFIDVLTRKSIGNLNFVLIIESDTTDIYIDSSRIVSFDLKRVGNYRCAVVKEGYDTLYLEFENTNESTEHILEFFLPRTDLTKDEKKEAHKQSRILPERSDERSGGFQKVIVRKGEFMVLRYRAYLDDSSTKEYGFRKIRTNKH